MSLINRYSNSVNGAITFIGNTLGLSKKQSNLNAGTNDSIGAFITLNTALQADTSYPMGTTFNWEENSSAAILNLPSGSVILYAELIWSAQYTSQGQAVDVTAYINDPVVFKTPIGTYSISIDPTTAQTVNIKGERQWYIRSNIVTNLVQGAGNGQYSAGKIAGTNDRNDNDCNAVGWTLAIVYENNNLPLRNMNLYVGQLTVDTGETITQGLTSIQTPNLGPINSRVFLSALEGDPAVIDDRVLLNGILLQGPNNPSNNIFGSQINGDNGLINTTGTFGTRNNVSGSSSFIGARQGYDITSINTNNYLNSNSTSTQLQLTTQTDRFMINAVGLQIDLGTTGMSSIKTVNLGFVDVGGVLLYVTTVINYGNTDSLNVIFQDTIPNGTSYINNSFIVNGISIPNSNPEVGVNLGNISVGETKIISFNVIVDNTLPSPNPILNTSILKYEFSPANSIPNISVSKISNSTVTTVNTAAVSMVKEVDKLFADIGDTLNYNIRLKNNGNVVATSSIFRDITPAYTTFIDNTFKINGIVQSGVNPTGGVNLGNITPNQEVTLSFNVTVINIPPNNYVDDYANIIYRYISDPSLPEIIKENVSNTVTTEIRTANISGLNSRKAVNLTEAVVGDTLLYNIYLKNTGNVTALNVVLLDTIPTATTFITDSVKINGTTVPGLNPSLGINLGSIKSNELIQLDYNVFVNTIPSPNTVLNSGYINYGYIVDPLAPNRTGQSNTNVVSTSIVESAKPNPYKIANITYGDVDEYITYLISFANRNSFTVNNVTIFDTVPNNTSYVSNSVKINGISAPSENPQNGVNVGALGPNQVVTVEFNVNIDSIPTNNFIVNDAQVNYEYGTVPFNASLKTDKAYTEVRHASIDGAGAIKNVDLNYATVGDILNYEIVLKNTGNVSALNVVFSDPIPLSTVFENGSVKVNNIPRLSDNPAAGITLGTMVPNAVVTITFKVSVVLLPTIVPIQNIGNIKYDYTVDPSIPNIIANTSTNTVSTYVNYANISGGNLTKVVNRSVVGLNEILSYSTNMYNSGNTTAFNVILKDTIPHGTRLINDSVTINGAIQYGVNPQNGINIGSISSNENVVVAFQTIVTTIPSPNPIENTGNLAYKYTVNPIIPTTVQAFNNTGMAKTQVNAAILSTNKAVDRNYATRDDVLDYTIILENNGNITGENVIIKDTIPSGTTFVPNSLKVNNVTLPGVVPENLLLDNMAPGEIRTINFKVIVYTLPNVNPTPNSAIFEYKYSVEPSTLLISNSLSTNIVTTQINEANLSTLVKYADRTFANCGDIINYTIIIPNIGNVTAQNVVFKDTIPSGTTLIPTSVYINNAAQSGANPSVGITIPNIAPGTKATVTFSVQVQC